MAHRHSCRCSYSLRNAGVQSPLQFFFVSHPLPYRYLTLIDCYCIIPTRQCVVVSGNASKSPNSDPPLLEGNPCLFHTIKTHTRTSTFNSQQNHSLPKNSGEGM